MGFGTDPITKKCGWSKNVELEGACCRARRWSHSSLRGVDGAKEVPELEASLLLFVLVADLADALDP